MNIYDDVVVVVVVVDVVRVRRDLYAFQLDDEEKYFAQFVW